MGVGSKEGWGWVTEGCGWVTEGWGWVARRDGGESG